MIVGIVVGIISVIAAIFAIVIYIVRKRAAVKKSIELDSDNNKSEIIKFN